MKKTIVITLGILVIFNNLQQAAHSGITRELNQYKIYSDSSDTNKNIEAWGLFSLILQDIPQALKLNIRDEQARLQDFVFNSLQSAQGWATASDNKHLLSISALNGLATLLGTHQIDTKEIQTIFSSRGTTNPSILSQLQSIIPAYVDLSDFYPQLKEALYGFLRSYHDRFGHQAFTDFPKLSTWIKKDINRSQNSDLMLLAEKMERWLTSVRNVTQDVERDIE